MYIVQHILLAFGGIALFLLGLKFMSENMEKLTGEKMKQLLGGCTKNKYLGILTGAFTTGVLQSSVATNIILVGFVSNGLISFYQASAVIMGTNIGTTITAQLVSLSGSNVFDITSLGAIMVFSGFILSFSKRQNYYAVGNVMMGFGMLFFGLNVVSECIGVFKSYEVFCNIFLVKNSLLLLLNVILITAIVQSSSAVTSVMIILASNGLLTFENSMFLVLGANIGTCFAVIWASLNKSVEGRRTAFFNIAFNIFGSIILFLPLCLFKSQISSFFMLFSNSVERQIANFHTLFNIFVTLILLPILKPFTTLISKLVKDEPSEKTIKLKHLKKLKA